MTSITFEFGIARTTPTVRPARRTTEIAIRPAVPPVVQTAARPTPRGEVHLTRRGRLVVFALCLAVVVGAGLWLFGATSAATRHAQPTRVVVVGSGETLWDIAADVAPAGRTGDTVARLQRLNHLDSSMVLAGQRLLVPVGE